MTLTEWLNHVGALPHNQIAGPNGSVIRFYGINGREVLIQYWERGRMDSRPDGSWDIYIPPSTSNEIQATLDAAGRQLFGATYENIIPIRKETR